MFGVNWGVDVVGSAFVCGGVVGFAAHCIA